MRPFLLILATLVLIVGGFLAYSWFEPASPTRTGRTLTDLPDKPRSSTTRSLRGLQIGESVWVRRYDRRTGELSSQFKGAKYVPQSDDTVFVEKPEAEFFSRDGQQRIRIEGASGNVVMNLPPEERPGQLQSRVEPEAPSRGKLHDVTISMFEPADADEPVLVAGMNNAAFDNDTFRIATESYVDSTGQTVPADQVPVVVRGRDYDFDGRGLVIRWNERDQKLQLLEIAHGQSLTLKDPAALSGPLLSSPASRPVSRPSASSGLLATSEDGVVPLPASQPAPARPARKRPKKRPASVAAPPATNAHHRDPVVYRATFEREVLIFEAGSQVVSASSMAIDFLQPDSEAPDRAIAPEADPVAPVTAPATPTARHAATTAPSSDESPGTQPVAGPVVLKWQGKLSIVPLDGPPDPALSPGKARVQLTGSPVLLTRDGTEARAGLATFNTADESASFHASESVREVTMTDANGAKVATPRLDFTTRDEQRFATLTGPSRAEIPVESQSDKPQTVLATWNDGCELRLSDDSPGQVSIEEAKLNGAVKVDHPELKLSSDALRLAFEPPDQGDAATGPSTSPARRPAPALRQVAASGNVKCDMLGAGDLQSIETQSLQIAIDKTPGGRLFARQVVADGDVRTRENGSELRAGQIVAELAPASPSSRPATTKASGAIGGDVRLVSLLASRGVTLTTPDGQKASADKLIVESREGSDEYSLIGKPLASVTDGKTTISGAAIRMTPRKKLAQIEGNGMLVQQSPDDPSRRETIAWDGGATVDGNADTIELRDRVVVESIDADGAVNEASADRLTARLVPRPTTNPAAATRPGKTDEMNFLTGKDIGSAALAGNVKVTTERRASDDTIEQAMTLLTERVDYDRVAGSMEAPGPGQMLYEDNRPSEAEQARDARPTLTAGRGKTAFGWKDSLRFDENRHKATMTGDVRVVHHPSDKDAPPLNLNCDALSAWFEPDKPAPATTRAAAATTAPSFQLRRVTAEGRVQVDSARLDFDSRDLSFDPEEELLIATGDASRPITVTDNVTGSTQTASELRWNTRTDQFRITDLGGKVRP